MQLTDFIKNFDNLNVKGVTSDSRRVSGGFLFAALPGQKLNGEKFIEDAIQHGACFILLQEGLHFSADVAREDVTFVYADNVRQAFSQIAAKFYKLQPKNIVAVTGTSGKTSTVSFVQQLWHLAGVTKCASLGTLGVRGPGMRRGGALTTPDAEVLHAELADLAAVGIDHVAMEASSHGLDQHRLDGVNVSAAAYTNLSRDHLDYHAGMDEYFVAKSRLFSAVMEEGKAAVLNADDEYFNRLQNICIKSKHHTISFGKKGGDICLNDSQLRHNGQDICFSVFGKDYQITLPLVGGFQTMNALCALGLVLSIDNDPKKYVPLLSQLRGVSGRLQLIGEYQKGAVYVDYAHKPAALETVLKTLRPHVSGELVCVFGCGGNRDPGKRPLMGTIAGELADQIIVTDDNPRYEDSAEIREQIIGAVPSAVEIGDRAKAIQFAMENLKEGDVLVVAGKGHEQGQIVGEEVYPFDDAEEIKKIMGVCNFNGEI